MRLSLLTTRKQGPTGRCSGQWGSTQEYSAQILPCVVRLLVRTDAGGCLRRGVGGGYLTNALAPVLPGRYTDLPTAAAVRG